ncbi:hypothetical protein [Teichococcus aestuarii]|uniref:hypothetical protein n=1 Tax=Teichococcus aestuarii TaxID=568898 RepID=UPI003623087A
MTGGTPSRPAPRRRSPKSQETAAAKAPRRPKAATPKGGTHRKPSQRPAPPAAPNPLWREVADYVAGVAMLGAAAWGLMAFLDVL